MLNLGPVPMGGEGEGRRRLRFAAGDAEEDFFEAELRFAQLDEFVFFFQAGDGIRDVAVTGVQTCALPISPEYLAMEKERVPHQQQIVEAITLLRTGLQQGKQSQVERQFCMDRERLMEAIEASFAINTREVALGAKFRLEEHTSELQSRLHLVCRLLLEKKKIITYAAFLLMHQIFMS